MEGYVDIRVAVTREEYAGLKKYAENTRRSMRQAGGCLIGEMLSAPAFPQPEEFAGVREAMSNASE